MSSTAWSVFDSPIGVCGIAWSQAGVRGVQLPEQSEAATRARMTRRFPQAIASPPAGHGAEAIAAIRALLQQEAVDLSVLTLDMESVPAFHQRVYALARHIPPGETWTYGDLARRLGGLGLARAVGQALGHNPFAIIVPCHRVVAANGKPGGFSAHGGTDLKFRLLVLEGMKPAVDLLPF